MRDDLTREGERGVVKRHKRRRGKGGWGHLFNVITQLQGIHKMQTRPCEPCVSATVFRIQRAVNCINY